MADTLRKSTANLKKLTGVPDKPATPEPEQKTGEKRRARRHKAIDEVLIGANFPRVVRRSIALLQADPRNDGKPLRICWQKDSMISSLNMAYRKPQRSR